MHSQRCKSPCLPIAPSPVIHGIMSGPPHADLSSTSSVEDLTYWETHQQAMCGRRLTYSAEEHGWSAAAFHGQVDTFGAAVVLGRTAGGAVFGGYNPRGWIGKPFRFTLHSNCAGPTLRVQHRPLVTSVAIREISHEHISHKCPSTTASSAWQSVARSHIVILREPQSVSMPKRLLILLPMLLG